MPVTTPFLGTDAFTGKVAFVSGAASGIGRATATAFATHGAAVAVADIDEDGAHETARLIDDAGGTAVPLRCDITSTNDLDAAMTAIRDQFGRLDLAFNNAGVEQLPPQQAIETIPRTEWDRIISINLTGAFLAMQAQIPLLLDTGGGAIVNTSSGEGVRGFQGGAAYRASKHGVIGLTRCAALDHAAHGIRINAICPGIIDTEMMHRFTGGTDEGRRAVIAQEPIGRMGNPKRSPPRSSGCARTPPPSPSATPWSSTAARPCRRCNQRRAPHLTIRGNQETGLPAPDDAITGQQLGRSTRPTQPMTKTPAMHSVPGTRRERAPQIRIIFVAALFLTSACAGSSADDRPRFTGSTSPPVPDSASEPAAGSSAASTPTDTEALMAEDTPITISIGDAVLDGRLWDNPTAHDLITQLPLTLEFRDLNNVEKIARLPLELAMDGVPEGDDPEPQDIGYYAPSGDLVLYYEDVGYWDGIVRLGAVDSDIEAIRSLTGTFTATIETLD